MVRGPQPITTENNMFQCDKFIVHAVHLNFYHFSSAFFFFFILERLPLRIRILFQSLFSARTCHKRNNTVYDGLSLIP